MSIRPSKRTTHFVMFAAIFAAVAAAVFLLAHDTRTTSGDDSGQRCLQANCFDDPTPSQMKLVVTEPEGVCTDEGVCQFPLGAQFQLGIEVVTAPPEGYTLGQTYVNYGPDITYDPSPPAADEIVWPECEPSTAVKGQFWTLAPDTLAVPTDEVVFHGCLTGLLPPQPTSTYVGMFVEFVLTCSTEASRTDVHMVEYERSETFDEEDVAEGRIAVTNGTKFNLPAEHQSADVIPKMSGLTVFCGDPPTPTPSPTITPGGPTLTPTPSPEPTATPTVTPTPSPLPVTPTATFISVLPCGDVNGDLKVDSLDALWVLWFASNEIHHLPFPADIDEDGVVGPLDALFILWIELRMYICR